MTFRENLIDRMILLYGYENPITIQFANYCEEWEQDETHDHFLELLVKAHEMCPYMEKE